MGPDMRILAAADVHGFLDVYRWLVRQAREQAVEAVVLGGDLLGIPDENEDVEAGMRACAEEIQSIFGPLGRPVLYIMGNDDLIDLPPHAGFEAIHRRRLEIGGTAFVGYAGGPPFLGGPFDREPPELERELAALEPLVDARTVLVTHYPAAGTLDETFHGETAGLQPIRSLVERRPFLIHVHGHIHGRFGRVENHLNVASAGRKRAMVIELPSRTHWIVEERDSSEYPRSE